jgi:sulfur relay (sulfurtransferase) DsrC/TusE family protein
MSEDKTLAPESSFDEDGFLKTLSNWNPSVVQELAEKNEIGPLTEEH